jgi:hypothetical protein
LIGVYRELGGGWEFRLSPEAAQIDAGAGAASNCVKSIAEPASTNLGESVTVNKTKAREEIANAPAEELGAALRRRNGINRHTGSAASAN